MHEFETSTRIAVRGETKGHACAQCGGLADEHPEPIEEVVVPVAGPVPPTPAKPRRTRKAK